MLTSQSWFCQGCSTDQHHPRFLRLSWPTTFSLFLNFLVPFPKPDLISKGRVPVENSFPYGGDRITRDNSRRISTQQCISRFPKKRKYVCGSIEGNCFPWCGIGQFTRQLKEVHEQTFLPLLTILCMLEKLTKLKHYRIVFSSKKKKNEHCGLEWQILQIYPPLFPLEILIK